MVILWVNIRVRSLPSWNPVFGTTWLRFSSRPISDPGPRSSWASTCLPWWCNQMEKYSTLLALCVGNSPVTGEFPSQRPVMQSFDAFFDLRMNKRLIKHSISWWFGMLSCPFGCLHLGQWPMTYLMTLSDWTMSCQPWPPRARYGQWARYK